MRGIEMKISKGQLILISTGDYSDYGILDTFRALRDFDTKEVIECYFTKYPLQSEQYEFDDDIFILWLISEQLVVELETVEWKISSYSTVDMDG